MNNEEKILVLLEQHSEMFAQINSRLDKMDERLNRMDSRLDKMDERLDRMEEYAEITRDGVNALLDWAEACSETYSLPLPKICAGGHHADKLHDRHRSCGRRPCYQHELSAAPALPRHERQCRGGSRLR